MQRMLCAALAALAFYLASSIGVEARTRVQYRVKCAGPYCWPVAEPTRAGGTRRSSAKRQVRRNAKPRHAVLARLRTVETVHVDNDGRVLITAAPAAHRIQAATPSSRSAEREQVSVSAAGGSDLVAKARQYIGTNPTGWARLWCARFMAMIAPHAAAHVRNPNWALDWAALPRTPMSVGAAAVMTRPGGGHIGIVSGITPNGDPVIIAGNAGGNRVREYAIPRGRILAYVRL
jgi:hypothetical protein